MSDEQFTTLLAMDCDACNGRIPEKTPREDLLRSLVPGDVFEAISIPGIGFWHLVTALDGDVIQARRLIVRRERCFDRLSGETIDDGDKLKISSVEPLSPDVYGMVLWLDRKYRLLSDSENAKLTKDEIETILSAQEHYESHRI